jgi:hypothetical protein
MMRHMLTGPQRKFCEGIVVGKTATDAYAIAYPKSSPKASESGASRLLRNDKVKAEIARLRAKADEKAGSAVLTLAEKRSFLKRLLFANVAQLDVAEDGDLLAGLDRVDGSEGSVGVLKIRLPDKLAAIKLDNDLAGDGSEAGANDALQGLLERVMK